MSSRPSRGAARLAAILDALPDALLLVNCNGTVVNANHIALETFEVPGTGLVGRGLLDLLPEFDSRRIPGGLRPPRAEADGGRTKPTRMIARRTDGTQFPVEVTSANLEDGRTPYAEPNGSYDDELLMLVVRDLTGTLDTEAELARQQRQTEMILRAAAEGVVGVDTAGKVVLVNPSAAQILGYRASDLGGRELHPLIHHSRPDGTPFPYEESPIADTLRSGRKHRVRGQVLWAKDGRAVPVDLTTAPVRDGEQLVGAVMTFTDRRPYDALAARHQQLLGLVESSLRGPLDQLRAELGTLADDPAGQLWPEANQILHHLAAGYGRMATLVDNVLAYQRLDAGQDDLDREKVSLDDVVSAGVEGAVDLIGPGRAQFAVHAPAIEAEIDSTRFAQALAHLIADVAGVDATGAAAPGAVRTGDSTIVVAAAQRGDVVRIEVRGPHPGGDPVHGPLVRGIVRRHGGVLQTHDVPGAAGGRAYVLEVPLSAEAGPVPPPADRRGPDTENLTTVMPLPTQRGRGTAPEAPGAVGTGRSPVAGAPAGGDGTAPRTTDGGNGFPVPAGPAGDGAGQGRGAAGGPNGFPVPAGDGTGAGAGAAGGPNGFPVPAGDGAGQGRGAAGGPNGFPVPAGDGAGPGAGAAGGPNGFPVPAGPAGDGAGQGRGGGNGFPVPAGPAGSDAGRGRGTAGDGAGQGPGAAGGPNSFPVPTGDGAGPGAGAAGGPNGFPVPAGPAGDGTGQGRGAAGGGNGFAVPAGSGAGHGRGTAGDGAGQGPGVAGGPNGFPVPAGSAGGAPGAAGGSNGSPIPVGDGAGHGLGAAGGGNGFPVPAGDGAGPAPRAAGGPNGFPMPGPTPGKGTGTPDGGPAPHAGRHGNGPAGNSNGFPMPAGPAADDAGVTERGPGGHANGFPVPAGDGTDPAPRAAGGPNSFPMPAGPAAGGPNGFPMPGPTPGEGTATPDGGPAPHASRHGNGPAGGPSGFPGPAGPAGGAPGAAGGPNGFPLPADSAGGDAGAAGAPNRLFAPGVPTGDGVGTPEGAGEAPAPGRGRRRNGGDAPSGDGRRGGFEGPIALPGAAAGDPAAAQGPHGGLDNAAAPFEMAGDDTGAPGGAHAVPGATPGPGAADVNGVPGAGRSNGPAGHGGSEVDGAPGPESGPADHEAFGAPGAGGARPTGRRRGPARAEVEDEQGGSGLVPAQSAPTGRRARRDAAPEAVDAAEAPTGRRARRALAEAVPEAQIPGQATAEPAVERTAFAMPPAEGPAQGGADPAELYDLAGASVPPAQPTGRRRARRALAEEPGAAAPAPAAPAARPISVRTLGQGPGAGDTPAAGTPTAGSGRRRRLANPAEGDREAQAQAAAAAAPVRPQPLGSPEGKAFAVGAPDEGAEGPEPLDGPDGAVEVVEAVRPPMDDELPPEPLDNPRRLLVWPAPDEATEKALTERGYRPVIVHSREEVDEQKAAYPAALFVDPLTGPITRTALQSLREAATAAEVPVLVTAGLGHATREAAYGADPAVLLKALAPRDSEMHPPRVLLIEEHEPIANALTATLERRGMHVVCGATDSEAVQLAGQTRPNLVVMDLMQVRRRRAGIVDWLRGNGVLGRTPLVVYTSADIDPSQLPRLASGETVLFLAERSTSADVQGRIVDLLAKIGTN
ncbi:PAS domain-containing protein [Streptomyces sp. NPDC049585]|uniref:PAS domain-containing protein n=1 Tax=Streptomyces sp. NPDC049585 TaxID=3155154 RepID=UPI00343F333B